MCEPDPLVDVAKCGKRSCAAVSIKGSIKFGMLPAVAPTTTLRLATDLILSGIEFEREPHALVAGRERRSRRIEADRYWRVLRYRHWLCPDAVNRHPAQWQFGLGAAGRQGLGRGVEQEITADLPANTPFMSPRIFLNTGAPVAAVAFGCSGDYWETSS